MAEDKVLESAISVTAAVNIAKSLLQSQTFRIVGEVSELSDKPGYKAVYFTIKDEGASLSCLMWKNRYQAMGIPLRIGAKLVITGKFSIFAPKGRLNFDVSSFTLAGDGDLRAKVAQLAERLRKEGLMEASRKKPLVTFPERIGLVTSPRGAAVHDVLRTLRRRFPGVEVLFAGVPVEGKGAAQNLIFALNTVIEAGAEEVLLVRGGGSFEDLMPFNDEALARFIASSPVPIVTGIGHEPDTSIADMVADVRASTPTAAAETVSPDYRDVVETLQRIAQGLEASFTQRLKRSDEFLANIASRPVFKDPLSLFAVDFQMLDVLQDGLERSITQLIPQQEERVKDVEARLSHGIDVQLSSSARLLESQQEKLSSLGPHLLTRFSQQATLEAARLEDLSPLKTLGRGWSITKKGTSVVKSISEVQPGETISVQVIDGVIAAEVTAVEDAVLVDL